MEPAESGAATEKPEKAKRTKKTEAATALAVAEPTAPGSDSSAIMGLIQRLAVDNTIELARIDHLLKIKADFDAKEAKRAYIRAMADFKRIQPEVANDKKNVQYGSDYSSLGNLVNKTNDALGACGLHAAWSIQQDPIRVTCTITHIGGHSEAVTMMGVPDKSGSKNPLQEVRSTITYLEKATYEAVTGTVTVNGAAKDDDGNGSGGGAPRMDEMRLESLADWIRSAENLDSMREFYEKSYREAKDLGDKAAMKYLIQVKDERKAQLEKGGKR